MAIKRVSTGLLMLLLVAGCDKDAGPETVVVTGTVTYQGNPVELGRITFQPQDPDGARPAVGQIKAGGTYALSTYAAGDGVKPGNYTVLIESYRGGPTPEDPRGQKEWLIPAKYSSAESSDLTASIPENASGAVELNFDVN